MARWMTVVWFCAWPTIVLADPPGRVILNGPAAFSPDGKHVALIVGTVRGPGLPPWIESRLILVNTTTWKEIDIRPFPVDPPPSSAIWTADSSSLIAPMPDWMLENRPRFGRIDASAWIVESNRWTSIAKPTFAPSTGGNGDYSHPFSRKQAMHWSKGLKVWAKGVGGREVEPAHKIKEIRRIQVSPDGNYTACVVGGEATPCIHVSSKLFVSKKGDSTPINLGEIRGLSKVAWNHDGKRLLYIDKEGRVQICEIATGAKFVLASDVRLSNPSFHPVTDTIWAVGGLSLYEYTDGKWIVRFTYQPPPDPEAKNEKPERNRRRN